MGPHPQYRYDLFSFQDLVNQAVLNVDSAGAMTRIAATCIRR
jgi:hypothetical protein